MIDSIQTIVVATRNKGKISEFASLFSPLGIEVRSLLDEPSLPDIVEDGETFSDNADKKARTIADILKLPVLADDSGLCVDALNGEPGVYSARYAGEEANDQANIEKLLSKLAFENVVRSPLPNGAVSLSKASFVCVLSLHQPERGESILAEGRCNGLIIDRPLGTGGFGYDPVFYVPELDRTMAQISIEDKNSISHRSAALRRLIEMLEHQ